MSCQNQCTAYMGYKRCINETDNDSHHCKLHRVKAKQLYLKYKSLGDEIEQLDFNKPFTDVNNHMQYIMSCYCKLNNLYMARQAHKNYAFVPECYDEGHLHQLNKINDQMHACEKVMENLMVQLEQQKEQSNKKESKNNSKDKSKSKDNSGGDEIKSKDKQKNSGEVFLNVKRRINNYKNYRLEQEAQTNNIIEYYIQENKLILEERSKLIVFICAYIDNIFDSDMNYFIKHVSIYNLVHFLYSYQYFLPTFKPEKCDDITCQCYVPLNAVLACTCILNHSPIPANVCKYFQKTTIDKLSKYYEVLLLNKNKILPILDDLTNLYTIHQDKLLFIKVFFVWHPELKRLVLEENTFDEIPKMSKIYAQSRLKNKIYYQKLQQDYLTGKL